MGNMQGAARECDDFQISGLMNWVEYKNYKNYPLLAVKCLLIFACYILKITSHNWSPFSQNIPVSLIAN